MGVIAPDQLRAYDVVIAGSGAGGGTLAWALARGGARVLVIERGDFVPSEAANWDPVQVFDKLRYRDAGERWIDVDDKPFPSLGCYCVGGSTKFYGAALLRRREWELEAVEYPEGTTTAWPFRYADLEPYYAAAERLYLVHGAAGEDPSEPPRSGPFPFPAVAHEPYIAELVAAFRAQGLRPFHLPLGVDLRDGGRCVRCTTCDGHPCRVYGKADTETVCIRPALDGGRLDLLPRAVVQRLDIDETGHIARAVVTCDGATVAVRGDRFVLACGVIHTPAILLRSGLANGSGCVGRHLMVKTSSIVAARRPGAPNPVAFQKTWGLHDLYTPGVPQAQRACLQAMGKLTPARTRFFWPQLDDAEHYATESTEVFVMTEGLADPDNRVSLVGDAIKVGFVPNNLPVHHHAVEFASAAMRAAGYDSILVGVGPSTRLHGHAAGTVRCGTDPASSVLDPNLRAHEIANLYVCDASSFPSLGCTNPALTIIASALRLAHHLGAAPAG